ncbi:alpha/beta fold hydrolase [Streptomyces sp. NPDC048171]|uniref:alpha/beta fold hydrolase n=1 Tax=Streptomyces sp. NPDC048171 TaxID=3365504 RepID=UPI0037189EFC
MSWPSARSLATAAWPVHIPPADRPGPSGHRPVRDSQDTSSYRCDRLVDDVEALRERLGLARIDLLGHSAGTNIATQYAARYPEKVSKLALIGPSPRAVDVAITGETRRELAQLRKNEPWFPTAFAALQAITEGTGSDWEAVAPFFWGRWDATAQKDHAASQPSNQEAVALFAAEGAFSPKSTRAALASCEAPVLLLTGEFDLNSPPVAAAEFAEAVPDATLAVQPGAGHYPWLDDADWFVATMAAFLRYMTGGGSYTRTRPGRSGGEGELPFREAALGCRGGAGPPREVNCRLGSRCRVRWAHGGGVGGSRRRGPVQSGWGEAGPPPARVAGAGAVLKPARRSRAGGAGGAAAGGRGLTLRLRRAAAAAGGRCPLTGGAGWGGVSPRGPRPGRWSPGRGPGRSPRRPSGWSAGAG